jgi:hypothetical protein
VVVKYLGASAAWLRLTASSHNVLTALKRLVFPAVKCRPLQAKDDGPMENY